MAFFLFEEFKLKITLVLEVVLLGVLSVFTTEVEFVFPAFTVVVEMVTLGATVAFESVAFTVEVEMLLLVFTVEVEMVLSGATLLITFSTEVEVAFLAFTVSLEMVLFEFIVELEMVLFEFTVEVEMTLIAFAVEVEINPLEFTVEFGTVTGIILKEVNLELLLLSFCKLLVSFIILLLLNISLQYGKNVLLTNETLPRNSDLLSKFTSLSFKGISALSNFLIMSLNFPLILGIVIFGLLVVVIPSLSKVLTVLVKTDKTNPANNSGN